MPTLATNKMAFQAYRVHETWEAGIQFTGPEVRSAKLGHVQMKGSYVSLRDSKIVLVGLHVSAYGPASGHQRGYEPTRERTLILTKKEVSELIGKIQAKGLTIIPLKLYTKGGLIKVEIGLVSSKSKRDKRESIKKKEMDRELQQRLRGK